MLKGLLLLFFVISMTFTLHDKNKNNIWRLHLLRMLRSTGAGLAARDTTGSCSASGGLVSVRLASHLSGAGLTRCRGGSVSLVLAALGGECLVMAVPGAVGTVLRKAALVVPTHLETCIKLAEKGGNFSGCTGVAIHLGWAIRPCFFIDCFIYYAFADLTDILILINTIT